MPFDEYRQLSGEVFFVDSFFDPSSSSFVIVGVSVCFVRLICSSLIKSGRQ